MTFDEWWMRNYPDGTAYDICREAWDAALVYTRPQSEPIALLRELNDALAIPGWLQPRVDAILDRAEEK